VTASIVTKEKQRQFESGGITPGARLPQSNGIGKERERGPTLMANKEIGTHPVGAKSNTEKDKKRFVIRGEDDKNSCVKKSVVPRKGREVNGEVSETTAR